MGRLTKYRQTPDQAYDPRITNLRRPLNMPAATGPQSGIPYADPATGLATTGAAQAQAAGQLAGAIGQGWTNKNVTNLLPVTLVAGVSQRILAYNPKRSGLEIQNQDATATLSYSFSQDLQGSGLQIGPGGAALYDFTTPPDTVYLFCAAANIQVCIIEISRLG